MRQQRLLFGDYMNMKLRICASLVDVVLQAIITGPILLAIYGQSYFNKETLLAGPADFFISYVLPIMACVVMLIYKRSTPGKMIFGAVVVDADTHEPLTVRQAILRSACYMVSVIPLGAGFIWAFFDSRKQGWHDKLANTVVIMDK